MIGPSEGLLTRWQRPIAQTVCALVGLWAEHLLDQTQVVGEVLGHQVQVVGEDSRLEVSPAFRAFLDGRSLLAQ